MPKIVKKKKTATMKRKNVQKSKKRSRKIMRGGGDMMKVTTDLGRPYLGYSVKPTYTNPGKPTFTTNPVKPIIDLYNLYHLEKHIKNLEGEPQTKVKKLNSDLFHEHDPLQIKPLELNTKKSLRQHYETDMATDQKNLEAIQMAKAALQTGKEVNSKTRNLIMNALAQKKLYNSNPEVNSKRQLENSQKKGEIRNSMELYKKEQAQIQAIQNAKRAEEQAERNKSYALMQEKIQKEEYIEKETKEKIELALNLKKNAKLKELTEQFTRNKRNLSNLVIKLELKKINLNEEEKENIRKQVETNYEESRKNLPPAIPKKNLSEKEITEALSGPVTQDIPGTRKSVELPVPVPVQVPVITAPVASNIDSGPNPQFRRASELNTTERNKASQALQTWKENQEDIKSFIEYHKNIIKKAAANPNQNLASGLEVIDSQDILNKIQISGTNLTNTTDTDLKATFEIFKKEQKRLEEEKEQQKRLVEQQKRLEEQQKLLEEQAAAQKILEAEEKRLEEEKAAQKILKEKKEANQRKKFNNESSRINFIENEKGIIFGLINYHQNIIDTSANTEEKQKSQEAIKEITKYFGDKKPESVNQTTLVPYKNDTLMQKLRNEYVASLFVKRGEKPDNMSDTQYAFLRSQINSRQIEKPEEKEQKQRVEPVTSPVEPVVSAVAPVTSRVVSATLTSPVVSAPVTSPVVSAPVAPASVTSPVVSAALTSPVVSAPVEQPQTASVVSAPINLEIPSNLTVAGRKKALQEAAAVSKTLERKKPIEITNRGKNNKGLNITGTQQLSHAKTLLQGVFAKGQEKEEKEKKAVTPVGSEEGAAAISTGSEEAQGQIIRPPINLGEIIGAKAAQLAAKKELSTKTAEEQVLAEPIKTTTVKQVKQVNLVQSNLMAELAQKLEKRANPNVNPSLSPVPPASSSKASSSTASSSTASQTVKRIPPPVAKKPPKKSNTAAAAAAAAAGKTVAAKPTKRTGVLNIRNLGVLSGRKYSSISNPTLRRNTKHLNLRQQEKNISGAFIKRTENTRITPTSQMTNAERKQQRKLEVVNYNEGSPV